MKNKFKLITILLTIVAISHACKKEDGNHHRNIRLTNKTDMLLYVECGINYPDTTFDWSGEAMVYSSGDMFKAFPKTQSSLWHPEFYEVLFKYNKILSDTLVFFIFDGKQLESNPIEANEAIIQYYYLSLSDLNFMNWTLSYPPSPKMSEIKMYPPYKQMIK